MSAPKDEPRMTFRIGDVFDIPAPVSPVCSMCNDTREIIMGQGGLQPCPKCANSYFSTEPVCVVGPPWSIELQGTRAARTVTNGTYRYTFFGDDAPENAHAVRDALNAVAHRKKL